GVLVEAVDLEAVRGRVEEDRPPAPVVEPELALGLLAGRGGDGRAVAEVAEAGGDRRRAGGGGQQCAGGHERERHEGRAGPQPAPDVPNQAPTHAGSPDVAPFPYAVPTFRSIGN